MRLRTSDVLLIIHFKFVSFHIFYLPFFINKLSRFRISRIYLQDFQTKNSRDRVPWFSRNDLVKIRMMATKYQSHSYQSSIIRVICFKYLFHFLLVVVCTWLYGPQHHVDAAPMVIIVSSFINDAHNISRWPLNRKK